MLNWRRVRNLLLSLKMKKHGVGSLMCEVCGPTFTHLQTLRKHKKRFQDEICYQCSDCAYEAEDSGALKKHRKYSHDGEKHMCNVQCL